MADFGTDFEAIVRSYELEKEESEGKREPDPERIVTPWVTLSREAISKIDDEIKAHSKNDVIHVPKLKSAVLALFAALVASPFGAAAAELVNNMGVKLPSEVTREAALAAAVGVGTWAYNKHRRYLLDGWVAARHMVATGRRPFEFRDIPTKAEMDKVRAIRAFATQMIPSLHITVISRQPGNG